VELKVLAEFLSSSSPLLFSSFHLSSDPFLLSSRLRFTMASSGSDYNNEKIPRYPDSTPISQGVRTHDDYDVERPKERKQSVVQSLRNAYGISETTRRPSADGSMKQYDETHRKLKPRHIQLIGIGGTIGTALYVQIGQGLIRGGPGSLFIAFTLW
jgi:hypothetical protein